MSDAISSRQTHILKALIDEYIEAAEPIGSESLEKKYSLGVSPATIRNEMMALTTMGYLKQPHTSAGRVPTPKAMKFYINQLMEEKQMSLTDEVKAKEEVWDVRDDLAELLEEATQSLAVRTSSLSIAVLDDGRSWHSGLANIFINPEFTDLNVCANVFSFIEEDDRLKELFFHRLPKGTTIEVFFGEELSWPELSPIGIVATHFSVGGKEGALGIIGPTRIKFPSVIPVLRYFGKMIEEIA